MATLVVWTIILLCFLRMSFVYTLQLNGDLNLNLVPNPAVTTNLILNPSSKIDDLKLDINLRSVGSELVTEPWHDGENYFIQKVDHFNTSSTSTFKQRFYVNDEFYQPGQPAILYLGGEGPLPSWRMKSGLTYDLCKQHNCMLFGLEHRYYGKSQPFKNWSTNNLQYLSIEQGLQDIINFVENVFERQTLSSKNTKWLVVGGSYPANLALWSKSKFPNLIHGAIASSAPVEALSDFSNYDKTVQLALGTECSQQVGKVVKYLDTLYDTDRTKFQKVKKTFGCQQVQDDLHFLYTVADTLSTIVQYNAPDSTPTLNQFCSAMTTSSEQDLLNTFIAQLKIYYDSDSTDCYKFSGDFDLRSTVPNPQAYLRQWTYQCCTQFGYWQTASPNSTTRSKHLTVEWFQKFYCNGDYYKDAPPSDQIDATNQRYKGKQVQLVNTIVTNGEFDPWATLSILPNSISQTGNLTSEEAKPKQTWLQRLDNESTLLLIKQASHVTDLASQRTSDSKALKEVRHVIHTTVRRWFS